MRKMFLLIVLFALSSAAFGQKLVIELDTFEGQMLQQIDGEQDASEEDDAPRNLRQAVPES